MMRPTIISTCAAMLLAACAGAVDPAPSAGETGASSASLVVAKASEPGMEIAASKASKQSFGIARWKAQRLDKSATIVALNDNNAQVFSFELGAGDDHGIKVVGREAMSPRQAEMADAYLADLMLDAELHPKDDELIAKSGGPGCGPCGGAPVAFGCIAVVLTCQDKQWCPDPNGPGGFSAQSCGSRYACGGCFGFSW